ncbi:uncharacterized protein LOC107883822 [Acyrthosiphon pisum]|uniref:MULE transposase domain-containing protein n=1 Tax=Acyrthosiphon pisum TaxID=7029 RepID=A0A8R2D3W4_ACYPI|nr:uncharacterized protein LOC107883822 [Acyrthosiphon pisum]|eukprot:XP_016660095.1 PREDICTED: uncharacterized protein LOC107883822 [Acyrthosiphon pisum]
MYTKAFRLIQNYLKPDKIYADFERAIHVAISEVWPSAQLKGCRFHLGQSWWRKIQQLELSKEFKNNDSEIGQPLKLFFGLSLLSTEEVNDSYTNEFISLKPINGKLEEFFDCILEHYIEKDSSFPPTMWAEYTSSIERTTTCCESFHSKFNSCFYSAHPKIFQFIDVLKEVQMETDSSILMCGGVLKSFYHTASKHRAAVKQLLIRE